VNLREEILKEHSKAQCEYIVAWIGSDQSRFDELLHLFLTDEYRVVQRSAWPLSYCVIAHPEFISRYWRQLIDNLFKPGIHMAVKRNTIRMMEGIGIPEDYEGEMMDLCINYVASPTEAVAVKAHSLTILGKLCRKYPEIIPELKLIIEDQLPHQTPAFKARAKRLLKEWKK